VCTGSARSAVYSGGAISATAAAAARDPSPDDIDPFGYSTSPPPPLARYNFFTRIFGGQSHRRHHEYTTRWPRRQLQLHKIAGYTYRRNNNYRSICRLPARDHTGREYSPANNRSPREFFFLSAGYLTATGIVSGFSIYSVVFPGAIREQNRFTSKTENRVTTSRYVNDFEETTNFEKSSFHTRVRISENDE